MPRHSAGQRRRDSADRLVPLWLVADGLGAEERTALGLGKLGKGARVGALGPSTHTPFHARAVLRMQPDIGLQSFYGPAARWVRPAETVKGTSSGIILLRPSDGVLAVEQDQRRAIVPARDAVLISPGSSATLQLTDVSRIDCFALPPECALPRARFLETIRHDNGALVMLANYGAALMRGLLPMNSERLRTLTIQYMADLTAMIAEEDSRPEQESDTSRTASRLTAIKADIEARLDQRNLSAGAIADLHSVSTRYLQKLFEREGQTFSEFVLERRLDRALRLLQTSDGYNLQVSSIAFDVGFGDLSYFNRTFRKRFGDSPSILKKRQLSAVQSLNPVETSERET